MTDVPGSTNGVVQFAITLAAGILSLVASIVAGIIGFFFRNYVRKVEALEAERSAISVISVQLAGLGTQFEGFNDRMESHHRENSSKLDRANEDQRDWRENVFQPALEALRLQAAAADARIKHLEDRRRR